jgi:hypothetical protein
MTNGSILQNYLLTVILQYSPPILSPDEKTLYFVSDMPGTIGLSDLFKTQIKTMELLVLQ